LLFTGESLKSVREDVIANFDAKAFRPRNDYRILVATEVLAEGVNLHRSNVVINYDIPWNPTRLIQRVGRINRVDTKFDRIHTYNFFPTDEGNDLIKLRESAEAKIHAFIQMLGADARLLTDGEEIVSHDLFAKWNSKKTITGEDEEEETELEFLTEIRAIRDKQPELFEHIKRLPKKARSTRMLLPGKVNGLPAVLTYFRQGKLDKFFLGTANGHATELDFMSGAHLLKPNNREEARRTITREFYDLLDKNRAAFITATSADGEEAESAHRGSTYDAYILKRLKDKAVRRSPQFTEDDDDFIRRVISLLEDGALPKATAKKLATSLKKSENFEPLKVLAVLRRGVKEEFFQPSPVAHGSQALARREVILSSFLAEAQ
jgi:superfamily II DNA/RNA helicase